MKTASTQLKNHLQQDVTSICTCWYIKRRDGVEMGFTDHDKMLTIGGIDYLSAVGYQRTAISSEATSSVDNLDLVGVLDEDAITRADLENGVYDYAEAEIFLVNWKDLTMGKMSLRKGWFGEIITSRVGVFKTELRGLAQLFTNALTNVYGPLCRVDLGSPQCKIPIDPPLRQNSTAYQQYQYVKVATDTGAVGQAQFENRIYMCLVAGTTDSSEPVFDISEGGQTVDGGVTWVSQTAWTRHSTVVTVTDRGQFTITPPGGVPDGYYSGGVIYFENGPNAGRSIEIRNWVQSTGQVTLYLPLYYLPGVGNRVRIWPGCDKTLAMCEDKFKNAVNMRAEPHLPGMDEYMQFGKSSE